MNKGASEEFIFGDTFLDFAHVVESFPSAQVQYQTASGDVVPINRSVNTSEVINTAIPTTTTTPASVQPKPKGKGRGKKAAVVEEEVEAVPVKSTQAPTSSSISSVPQSSSLSSLPSMSPPYRLKLTKSSNGSEIVTVSGITTENPGPFPEDASLTNSVRFTPSQIEAIRSGMNLGLTMIVGPPGTGKTDVAVQIIANLYKNFPTQKILLVTHSNSALNDLFEKIMQRDVDPRHLLRLGSGESDLRESLALSGAGGSGIGQGEIFSKQGRVNWSLARRMQLLGQVQRLGVSLGTPGDVGYTCETAQYFRIKVQHQIDEFKRRCSNESTTTISDIFPFNNYFSNTPTPLFTNHDRDADLTAAEGALHHLNKMFDELSDYRAFEVLRTQALRTDYLLTKQVMIALHVYCTYSIMYMVYVCMIKEREEKEDD